MLINEEKKFAVIGSPIEHSFSPDIHLPVLRQFCRKVSYEKVRVEPNELSDWISRVRREKVNGFNITMPHKRAVIPFLDEVQLDAQIFQAVNTVVNREGKLYGYNTDGKGLSLSLKRKSFEFKNSKILLFGAGDVAGTIALQAAIEGARQIVILGRTPIKAKKICEKVRKYYPKTPVCYGGLDEKEKFIKTTDIFINATPLGMKGFAVDFRDLSFLQKNSKEILVCDLIYNPPETSLLEESRKNGFKTLNGLGMLIYQGLLADQLFLNVEFNIEMMYHTVANVLEGKVNPL
ncbi:MAG: shikimate dehydrogenase [Anaerovoracaceae bacterium]|jgi:shikimate dehydrogenase